MLDPDGKVPFIFPIDNVMLENIQLFLWKVEGHVVFWLSICPVPQLKVKRDCQVLLPHLEQFRCTHNKSSWLSDNKGYRLQFVQMWNHTCLCQTLVWSNSSCFTLPPVHSAINGKTLMSICSPILQHSFLSLKYQQQLWTNQCFPLLFHLLEISFLFSADHSYPADGTQMLCYSFSISGPLYRVKTIKRAILL